MSNSTLNLYVKRISLVIGGLIAFAASTRASVIYNNLGGFPDSLESIAVSGPLYDSFTSAGSSQIISGLELKLAGRGGPGQITVGLFSDSGTSPGALIATLGIINDATITDSTGFGTYSLSLFSMPLLAASTRYWIGLSDTGAVQWSFSGDTSGVGVSGEYFANQGGVAPNISGPYQMRLSTSSVPGVPDSGSTACLLGFGVVVLVVMRRKLSC